MKIGELVEATGAKLILGSAGVDFRGISTDTRTIREGDVFFALKGPNFNGNSFVGEAFEKGASGVVVDILPALNPAKTRNVLVVRDTLRALGFVASHLRTRYFKDIPLIAVTGSAGKTTTKEMIASILLMSRPVLKSEGNKNNLIGLPLTLLRLNAAHKAAVVELGISEKGEMERLARICAPDVAVITNIGRGHLKTLGTVEGVARAKAELFEAMPQEAVRVVNLDDPWTVKISQVFPGKSMITFSLKGDADVKVTEYSIDEGLGGINAVFSVRGEKADIRLQSPAACNLYNAMAAIASVLPLGASIGEMQESLRNFTGVQGRMEILKAGGLTIIDDTYNANPESVAAALGALKSAKGRKVAVLGDMLELGDITAEAHREAGKNAAGAGVGLLVAVGENCAALAQGAVEAGMDAKKVMSFTDKDQALEAVKGAVKEGDTVLVKASRAAGLEKIVEGLKGAA